MKIIARYITKQLVWSFVPITTVLVLIVLSNRFALYLAKAATGELSLRLVFEVVALSIPELVAYLIPLGWFISILFVYGRLYADSEMTVLAACGISRIAIIRQILLLAFVLLFFTAFLTLWLVPKSSVIREEVLSKGEVSGALQSLVPQRFQTFANGRLVFYVEDLSKSDRLKGVFIAEQPGYTKHLDWTLITAERAKVDTKLDSDDLYLILNDGYRYQGIPGQANYTTVSFEEYGRALPVESKTTTSEALRSQNTLSLLDNQTPEDNAELQWRASLPLSVPILAMIAFSFSHVDPRRGRFAKFVPAIILYIVYFNLFTVSRRWVAAGTLPASIGVWWVHALFLVLGIGLLMRAARR